MKETKCASEHIDELLAYLQALSIPGRQFCQWSRAQNTTPDTFTLAYPIYDDDVADFFELAGQEFWCDFDYTLKGARRMLDDPLFIEQADLDEIKTMLTFCVRGERFCDGHWEAVLKNGRIQALLRRLEVIRKDQVS